MARCLLTADQAVAVFLCMRTNLTCILLGRPGRGINGIRLLYCGDDL